MWITTNFVVAKYEKYVTVGFISVVSRGLPRSALFLTSVQHGVNGSRAHFHKLYYHRNTYCYNIVFTRVPSNFVFGTTKQTRTQQNIIKSSCREHAQQQQRRRRHYYNDIIIDENHRKWSIPISPTVTYSCCGIDGCSVGAPRPGLRPTSCCICANTKVLVPQCII